MNSFQTAIGNVSYYEKKGKKEVVSRKIGIGGSYRNFLFNPVVGPARMYLEFIG